jgi:ribose transport system ATP-binding protein
VRLKGCDQRRTTPRARIRQGLAFLTENRREEGLCLEGDLASNIALVALPQHARPPFGLIRESALAEQVQAVREAVRLSQAPLSQTVKTLSGGNQQKVVLAKWLLAQPAALILDEPTRGIDVAARFEIYQLIHRLADAGTGLLVLSSDLEELIGICDRILVMSRGEIRDELERGAFERERIMAAALGPPGGGRA